jgi:hypothetical protein
MERYLKLENLQFALGSVADVPTLPSAEELQEMIGRAEVLMFIKQKRIPQELITIGWYLHSIASSRKSLEVYDVLRMRRAHQVSSHIFDLVLQNGVEDKTEVLSYMFAAQVGYIKGDLNPNAVAVYKNFNINNELSILVNHKDIALKLGVMLLALDRAELFKVLQKLRAEVHDLVDDTNNNLTPIVGIINSVWNLLLYLTYGYEDARTKASALLEQIVRNPSTTGDVNTRWVAAHLLDITDEFEKSSLWSVVPPEIPRNAIKAMTLGSPPILSLWPPQLELLGSDHSNSPLLLSTKRLLLSVPTSAGKTLLAQLFILSHLAQGGKGVCFIAPSHSLCREIQDSLASRLRFMNYNVAGSYPENMEEFNNNSADIEVMTPERFSFMLRNDIQRMLNDFSLFIIDEAHLISEQSRGLGLETSLSLVKLLTRSSPHRIFLMSAALGKEGHIHEWMQESEGSRSFHSEWRGPRRLYAMYSSEIDTSLRSETIPATTRRNYELKKYRLKGTVRLRIADTDQIHKVSLSTLVGELYLKRSFDGMVRHTLSTTQNRMLVPLIISVAESGPVLVIESTRAQAQDMAKYIAEQIAEDYEGVNWGVC